jgi:hypothetical protein
MRILRTTTITLLALGFVGCASHHKNSQAEMPASAASPERVIEIRSTYQRHDPNAQVGTVAAVDRESHLAAVGDLNLSKIRENDVITFIDSNENPIANGTVIRKTADYAHVKYEPTQRAPVEGDIAVRF